jgi:hypothetical protein
MSAYSPSTALSPYFHLLHVYSALPNPYLALFFHPHFLRARIRLSRPTINTVPAWRTSIRPNQRLSLTGPEAPTEPVLKRSYLGKSDQTSLQREIRK